MIAFDRHGIASFLVVKHFLIHMFILLSASLIAQEGTPDPRTTPQLITPAQDPDEEARALSGTLKDLLGQVHEHLGKLNEKMDGSSLERTDETLAGQQKELGET